MFYFLTICIVLYNIASYASFRCGIFDYLRLSKMSKSYIRKNRKGWKNYWLYHALHAQNSLGALYYLNIVFLLSTVIFSIFAVVCGLIEMMRPAILVLACIICVVEIPSGILASIYSDRADYGESFVLLAKAKYGPRGFHTSLTSWFGWIVTAFLIGCAFKQI